MDERNPKSQSSVESVTSVFSAAKLIVIDFSIMMTLKNNDLLDWLKRSIISDNKIVMVTSEFYRSYQIIEKSESVDQQIIARNARAFINSIDNSNCLKINSNYTSTESLVKAMISNPEVMFMFADYSEAAEAVRNAEKPKALIFFGILDGRFGCMKAEDYVKRPAVEPFVGNSENIVNIDRVPGLNESVTDSDGNSILLSKIISKGGEGTIYFTSIDGYVCKIFHPQRINYEKCEKLKYLVNRIVRFEGICWPEKIVYDSDHNPVGYLMKAATGKSMSRIFDGEDMLLENFPDFKRSDLVKICISIFEQYQYLHLLGVVIGDIRMNNIIIDENARTYLVDLDSCQIENFPCVVGDEDYTSAEIQGKNFSTFMRSFYNERFSWSVIGFNCLFLGQHPYAQIGGLDTMADEIALHTFKYPIEDNEDDSLIPVGCYKDIWKVTPKNIRQFFYDIFLHDEREPLPCVLLQMDKYYEYLTDKSVVNAYVNNVNPASDVVISIDDSEPQKKDDPGNLTPIPEVNKKNENDENKGKHKKNRSKGLRIFLIVILSILAAFAAIILFFYFM